MITFVVDIIILCGGRQAVAARGLRLEGDVVGWSWKPRHSCARWSGEGQQAHGGAIKVVPWRLEQE
jgi:hypothetical protein